MLHSKKDKNIPIKNSLEMRGLIGSRKTEKKRIKDKKDLNPIGNVSIKRSIKEEKK